jgi:hypothetical protein
MLRLVFVTVTSRQSGKYQPLQHIPRTLHGLSPVYPSIPPPPPPDQQMRYILNVRLKRTLVIKSLQSVPYPEVLTFWHPNFLNF